MRISRTRPESMRGPAEQFTGEVWHRHPLGQVLYVLEGEGLAQCRGGSVEAIRAGDTVRFDPDEEHWHGATPATFMTHLALQEVDDEGIPAYWGDHVSDDEYGAAA